MLIHSDLKDSLIDIEISDVVDIIRVFAAIGIESNNYSTFVPKLFPSAQTGLQTINTKCYVEVMK